MRIPKDTKRFRRDYAKLKRSGRYKMGKLHCVMEQLIDGEKLSHNKQDHSLSGKWKHLRDCHIEGDWILLYELGVNEEGIETITFHATDSHANLFG